MVFHSRFNEVRFPQKYSLPEFLFKPNSPRCDTKVLLPSQVSERKKASPLSLSETREYAYGFATGLLSSGIGGGAWQKGDVVILFSENQHDYIVYVLGALLAGVVPALVNPQYKPEEVVTTMKHVNPRALIVSPATLERAQKAAKMFEEQTNLSSPLECYVFDEDHELSLPKRILEPGLQLRAQGDRSVEQVKVDLERDPAIYCFSSGTSGLPKVVRISHANLVANVVQTTIMMVGRANRPLFDDANWYNQPMLPRDWDERQLHVSILPQFHCYGLVMAFVCLHTVTPNVVFSRYCLEHVLEAIQKFRATFMFCVPPIVLALATAPEVDRYDLSTLESIASGASALSSQLRTMLKERLNIWVTNGYGMTEMTPIVAMQTLADVGRESNPREVGAIVANTEARVVDISTGKDLGVDERGELWVRGPQMMLGYLDNDKANRNAFTPSPEDPDHYLKSGDLVSIDKNGRMTIHDRLKDVIKYNGFQVVPTELESEVHAVPGVLECAVVGKKDRSSISGNELPWAFVVPKEKDDKSDEARSKELMGIVNQRVAGYKKIRGVTWVDSLPKNSSGKILKRELAKRH